MSEHVLHPGQIEGQVRIIEKRDTSFDHWCSTAFICYETLYHLSSISQSGILSISTLAWGAQLDISSFRLHYGKRYILANRIEKEWVTMRSYVERLEHYFMNAHTMCLPSFLLLYIGSTFTPPNSRAALPVASCLTVEMRQYGDKDSAAEVLGIRNNGRLSEASRVRTFNNMGAQAVNYF